MNEAKTAQADEVASLIRAYLMRIIEAREIAPEIALAGAHAQITALMGVTFGPRAAADELRRAADELTFIADQPATPTTSRVGRA